MTRPNPMVVSYGTGKRPARCTCPKIECPRHGNCAACRANHLNDKRPGPPNCEREPSWFKKAFRAISFNLL